MVSQSVKFFAVTPPFQCSNLGPGNVTMLVKFYPARAGRAVTFATNVGPISRSEDENGIATVNFYPGSTAFSSPYHATATAASYQSAAAKKSSSISYNEQICLI